MSQAAVRRDVTSGAVMMAKGLGRVDRSEKMRGEGQGKFQTGGACQSRETVSKEILLALQVEKSSLQSYVDCR